MIDLAFDHIHLRSLDPDRAGAFYVQHLGGVVADRIETPDSLRVIVSLGGARLFVERVPAGTPEAPPRPHRGLEHIGFQVRDLAAAAASLRAGGVEFTLEPKTVKPGITIAFIRGPDDVSIELLERS